MRTKEAPRAARVTDAETSVPEGRDLSVPSISVTPLESYRLKRSRLVMTGVKGARVDLMMIGLMALLLLLAFEVTGLLTRAGADRSRRVA